MIKQNQWLFEIPFAFPATESSRSHTTEMEASGVILRAPRFRNDARLQATANNRPAMRQGERGRAVQILQQALIELGFPMPISTRRHGTPDGIYGPETTATVRKFQQKYGLKVDGIVGRNTMSRLDRLFSTRPSGNREPRCGVSLSAMRMPRVTMSESSFESPRRRTTPKRAAQPQPKLCFYQTGDRASNFFANQANRWAKRINAIASPSATDICQAIGATPYNTGEDIIRSIHEAFKCLNQPIQEVHIFSHSFPEGVIGNGDCVGLYRETSRSRCSTVSVGGRTVSQISTSLLSPNVVFVIHGCKTAVDCGQETNNFARDLFLHLAKTLENPRVFGHPISVCAGQRCTWCEYSKTFPNGRRLATIPSVYDGNGFCGEVCK